MKTYAILLAVLVSSSLACSKSSKSSKDSKEAVAAGLADTGGAEVDEELVAFIDKIKAVDNHTHANTTAKEDHESDALPLHEIFPFPVAVTLMPDHPNWVGAAKGLYGYQHPELSEKHMPELQQAVGKVHTEQGEKFPTWVLDKLGTEVMLTNRVAMGPGLAAPRFRWVPFADPLMFPLSTKAEAKVSPDRQKFYPHQEALLKRYMSDLKVASLPASLDAYLKTVVTPTLEAQKKGGAVAIKFEAALMRSLDFADVPAQTANAVYAKYAKSGTPSRAEYKAVQDFIFRHIAREAGRLGLAVHMHSFEGPGNFYHSAGADPLLLEATVTDPTMKDTNFLFVHGGGIFASHAGAMMWRPNVYVDTSAMAFMYPPERLAKILREWLTQHPDRVLFGSDASAFGPETPWELSAWTATTNARRALAMALTDMIRAGEVTKPKAQEIATMVMRTNAAKLYKLDLK